MYSQQPEQFCLLLQDGRMRRAALCRACAIVRWRIFSHCAGIRIGNWVMTRTAVGVVLAFVAAPVLMAQAPAVKVDRIEVARPGAYEIEVRGAVPDRAVSTGNRVEAKAYKNLAVGAAIPLKLGTVIGAELTVIGSPRRGKVPLRVVWRYPAPGLVNPQTRETRMSDEYADTQLVGEKFPVFWGLTQEWHLVRGTWTLEVWHGDRKLVDQPFQVGTP
jgi:hypothetical protein